MNGKKAKELRGNARGMTEGLPNVKTSWFTITTNVSGLLRKHEEIRLHNCTRAVYKRLKKEYKAKAA